MSDEGYWSAIEPYWDSIDIYSGPRTFLKTFRAAPHPAGLLYAAHFCQSEICNGGFEQFFFNSTGVLAPEAVLGFRAIGQPKIADLVMQAMKMFGTKYPRDRARRQAKLEDLKKQALDRLDQRFYKLIGSENGGFEKASDDYARTTPVSAKAPH